MKNKRTNSPSCQLWSRLCCRSRSPLKNRSLKTRMSKIKSMKSSSITNMRKMIKIGSRSHHRGYRRMGRAQLNLPDDQIMVWSRQETKSGRHLIWEMAKKVLTWGRKQPPRVGSLNSKEKVVMDFQVSTRSQCNKELPKPNSPSSTREWETLRQRLAKGASMLEMVALLSLIEVTAPFQACSTQNSSNKYWTTSKDKGTSNLKSNSQIIRRFKTGHYIIVRIGTLI